jgi:hypothetical protein
MRGVRRGFFEIQWVNHTLLLSSYNHFACLQVDTLIQPEICNIESKETIRSIFIPPFLTNTVAFQPGSVSYLANMLSPLAHS